MLEVIFHKMYDPLTAILFLLVGLVLGKALEKAHWIEKFIDVEAIRERFGKDKKDKKDRAIAE